MTLVKIEQYLENWFKIYHRKDGKKSVEIIRNFRPYYYHNDEGAIKKCVVETPYDIHFNRKNHELTFEADIKYPTRYLIDKIPVPFEKTNLKILYIDIETEMSVDWENTPEAIRCLTFYDNYTKEYKQFIFGENKKYETEEGMLFAVMEHLEQCDPDIITGWNVFFDMSYLLNRYTKCCNGIYKKLKYNIEKKFQRIDIEGIVVFDLFTGYKKINPKGISSFKLDNVALTELGEQKIEVKLKDLYKNKDYVKLLKYNKKDVELCVKLNERLGIIDYFDEIRRLVGCQWDSLMWNSNMIDVLVLREAKKTGMVLPSRVYHKYEKYQGAYVHTPTPGVHKNVACFDLKSLYPSLMCQFRISFDTHNKNGKIKLCNGERFEDREGLVVNIIKKLFDERNKFKKIRNGFDRKSVDYKLYNFKQMAVKFLVNSLYGYLGFVGSRLFNREVAESITLMGKEIILFTKDIFEKLGYEVIAGDTDSVYVKMGDDKSEKDIIEDGKRMVKILNEKYIEFVQKYGCEKNEWLEIQFECLSRKMFFSNKKKRYVSWEIWNDGDAVDDIKFKGFEVRRSDKPIILKEFQKKLFNMILKENKTQKEVEIYVKDLMKQIKNGDITLDKIVIPQSVTKKIDVYINLPIHIRGLKWSVKNLGESFDSIKLRMLYVINHETNVVCVDEDNVKKLEQFKVDYTKMFDYMFRNTLKTVYECLGWKYENLLPQIIKNEKIRKERALSYSLSEWIKK